jgi:ABC-type protease/lipase transport system fused ATPase/permease subunit
MKIPATLKGAAAQAALAATERMLPDAIRAVKTAQAALDAALAAGKDSGPYRAALAQAIQQKQALHSVINEKISQIDQRRQDKISAVAAAITAAAQDSINRLLQGYQFSIDGGQPQ